ncbi:DUF1254 domain-containing protein [Salmonella enterica subsp. enterica]|nr:DUF1254 domain-containing protein [Salmonella enterica subsp. enterica]
MSTYLEERMDSRAVVPTPNGDVIYSMSCTDLKETGPLVIKRRERDWHVYRLLPKAITDVGAIGPDRARGGLYLLLPPDYDGPVPRVLRLNPRPVSCSSEPYEAKGDGKPDPVPAVKARKQRASSAVGC